MSTTNFQALTRSSYLSSGNAVYLEDLYEQFLKNPNGVEPQWRQYFQNLPQVNSHAGKEVSHADIQAQFAQLAKQPLKTTIPSDVQYERQQNAINKLIEAYQTYGHLAADTNPLKPNNTYLPPELQLANYPNLTSVGQTTFDFEGKKANFQDILATLKITYCGSIGTEFMYIQDDEERHWIANYLKKIPQISLTSAEKKEILQQLIAADGLEKYLASKYVGQKRFSLEGGDSFIPLTRALNEQAAKNGVHEVIIGMAHRGRLSTLINVFGKSPTELFSEFEGKKDYGLTSGDVKYHMGYASDIQTAHGALHLSLAFNPSHLEIVNPVLMGSVRARQDRTTFSTYEMAVAEAQPSDGAAVLGLIVHGDASFAAQGVVMEGLQMSQPPAYKIDGVVHVVINNQVGFTTSDPHDARTSYYCTGPAKTIDAPILHVNGDDPEAVVTVARLAADYRAQFHKDIVIDLVCYRRLGHNEADEPAATQPLMYQFIRQHPVPRDIYAQRLIAEKIITQAEVDTMITAYRDKLDAAQPIVETHPNGRTDFYKSNWKPYLNQAWTAPGKTAVPRDKLMALGKKLDILPNGFEVQRQVGHILAARVQMAAGELPLDWGFAELLAYATLLDEGYLVRLTGEDTRRGTFSHRHATLFDQKTGNSYTPLAHISEKQAPLYLYDSILSEEAVMGFEYGYASTNPESLVLWEAQYGDFANGAQMVIDQFMSSAWQKWGILSGLVLLLPHGHEGAGPEHTSARLERYLQLCAQDNMQVCMPTTPAQIFHLLRRQVIRPYRTPLIVMSPKSMLRSKLAVSSLDELSDGEFQLVIPEIDDIPAAGVKRVILCSGKVYYDLLIKRRESKISDIAILRIEQLYPFPQQILQNLLKQYKNAKTIVWCQEEPRNQGSWYSLRHYLEACITDKQTLQYAGRDEAASPAAGYMKLHEKQQMELVQQALNG